MGGESIPMTKAYIAFNFVTAFLVVGGAAFGCVIIGGEPTKWQIVGCIVAGLGGSAKDTRSLLKLPPVTEKEP